MHRNAHPANCIGRFFFFGEGCFPVKGKKYNIFSGRVEYATR